MTKRKFTSSTELFWVVMNGAFVNFTPDQIMNGWEYINNIQKIKDKFILNRFVGNHIEVTEFPATKKGFKDAMKLLNI